MGRQKNRETDLPEPQFTQAPWEYKVRKNGTVLISIPEFTPTLFETLSAHYQFDLYTTPENAAVMAAAPELFLALRELAQESMELIEDVMRLAPGNPQLHGQMGATARRIARAREVLLKATYQPEEKR